MGRISQVGTGGATYYYLFDGLGSTMTLADSTGAVANTYDYDVYGATRATTGTQPNEFTFTGEQVDGSTGLEYLRARYYDQATGRFLGNDPASPDYLNPRSLNRFSYVFNNPVNLIDPKGECIFGLPCPVNQEYLNTLANRVGIENAIKAKLVAVLVLDTISLAFNANAAILTDAFTISSCIVDDLIGCYAGYVAGRAASFPLLLVGNTASSTSAVLNCTGTSVAQCALPQGTFALGWWLDPNLSTILAAYVLCLDAGASGCEELCADLFIEACQPK